MSEVTRSSMRDARDAEDSRLLESGEIDLLLAGWYETIVSRCVARMRGSVGHDVAQAVCLRLWKELKAGKHRDGTWPFRVIVHKVIGRAARQRGGGRYSPRRVEHRPLVDRVCQAVAPTKVLTPREVLNSSSA